MSTADDRVDPVTEGIIRRATEAITQPLTPQDHLDRILGPTLLFIGPECNNWTPQQFAGAATYARNLGYATICPRRAEGTIKYYKNHAQLIDEYLAVHNVGMGYFPFAYEYGPKFGMGFIDQEVAILSEMTAAIGLARFQTGDKDTTGFVMADMEIEYDGQQAAAQHFANLVLSDPVLKNSLLAVTTWADPIQQNWLGVIKELAPCVNQWVPQQYNTWLAHQPDSGMTNICPAVDLSQEFGPNNPVLIAQQAKNNGDKCLYTWEYSLTGTRRALAQAVNRTFTA